MTPAKMRVLFVCHRVPFPPKRGGKIRPFNIIRHLHEQGHEVTVASLSRDQAELVEAEGLGQHCSQRLVEIMDDRVAWPRMVAWLPTSRPSARLIGVPLAAFASASSPAWSTTFA